MEPLSSSFSSLIHVYGSLSPTSLPPSTSLSDSIPDAQPPSVPRSSPPPLVTLSQIEQQAVTAASPPRETSSEASTGHTHSQARARARAMVPYKIRCAIKALRGYASWSLSHISAPNRIQQVIENHGGHTRW